MLNFLKLSLFVVCLMQAQFLLGHDDHEHDTHTINAVDAQLNGLKAAKLFVQVDAGLGFGKLSESWSQLTGTATKLHGSGAGYYIVAVTNEVEKQILYVLMSQAGDLFDANFSGNFPSLNN